MPLVSVKLWQLIVHCLCLILPISRLFPREDPSLLLPFPLTSESRPGCFPLQNQPLSWTCCWPLLSSEPYPPHPPLSCIFTLGFFWGWWWFFFVFCFGSFPWVYKRLWKTSNQTALPWPFVSLWPLSSFSSSLLNVLNDTSALFFPLPPVPSLFQPSAHWPDIPLQALRSITRTF